MKYETYTYWKGELLGEDPVEFDRQFFKHFPNERMYVRKAFSKERVLFPEGHVLVTQIDEGVRKRQGMTPGNEIN